VSRQPGQTDQQNGIEQIAHIDDRISGGQIAGRGDILNANACGA
jgi:hypothetical protein